MVLGTLGKATVLRIPPELQNLTLRFGEATWKRETEDPRRKLVLLKYLNGSHINYSQGRMHFHELDFSLELLNTSRQDWQLYEYSVSKGPEEKVWQIQLEVYGETRCFGTNTLGCSQPLVVLGAGLRGGRWLRGVGDAHPHVEDPLAAPSLGVCRPGFPLWFAAGPGPGWFLSVPGDLGEPRQGTRPGFHLSPDANLCPLPPSLCPEAVSHPSIEILRWASVNGSCTATLNCTVERGDSVSYSWGSRDASGLCTHNGSLLHLSYPLKNTSITCTCTASNPVSSRVVTINTSQCSFEQAGQSPVAAPALSSLLVPLLLSGGFFTLL